MILDPKRLFHVKSKDFFGYPSCNWCRTEPCKFIQFKGQVRSYGSVFKIVHKSECKASDTCPFAVQRWNEVRNFLERLPLERVHREISWLLREFDAFERNHYAPAERYLWNYGDYGSKIEYLRILWRDGIYVFIRNPLVPQDDKVKEWLNAWHIALDTWTPREEKKEPASSGAETSAGPTGPTPELTVDKFRHLVDEAAKDRPASVKIGDKIMLTIKTKNIGDGEMVVIKVYNTAGTLARTLESLEARVKNNVADAEWVVAKDEKQADTLLEFDGSYKGVVSGRGRIEFDTIIGAIALKIASLFNSPLKDISCELSSKSKSFGTIVTDDQGLVVWNDIPFGSYTIAIKDKTQSIVLPVVWMSNPKRPFLFKMDVS